MTLPGVVAADHAVLAHHRRAPLERLRVPVERLAAPLVHRIEADIARLRHLEEQPAHHALPLRLHLGVERRLEFLAARLVLRAELLVDLARSSRTCPSSTIDTYEVVGLEIVVQLGARQRELRLRELLEAAAEADEHQVGLVAEHLHERRGAGVGHRQRTRRLRRPGAGRRRR